MGTGPLRQGRGRRGARRGQRRKEELVIKILYFREYPSKKKRGGGKKKKTNNRKRTLLVRQTSHNSFRAPFKSTATIRCLKEKTGGFPNQASVKNIYIFLFLVEEGGGQGDVASSSQQFSALLLHSIIELHC